MKLNIGRGVMERLAYLHSSVERQSKRKAISRSSQLYGTAVKNTVLEKSMDGPGRKMTKLNAEAVRLRREGKTWKEIRSQLQELIPDYRKFSPGEKRRIWTNVRRSVNRALSAEKNESN